MVLIIYYTFLFIDIKFKKVNKDLVLVEVANIVINTRINFLSSNKNIKINFANLKKNIILTSLL